MTAPAADSGATDATAATPRPWATKLTGRHFFAIDAVGPRHTIALTANATLEARANARLIAHAVNCHDELVAALRVAVQALLAYGAVDYEPIEGEREPAIRIVRAALTRAEAGND